MTTRTRVTKAEAEKVLSAVKRAFPAWARGKGAVGPKLVKDWNWGFTYSHDYDWAIVWEEGSPYNWTYLFPHGGTDEEFGGRHPAVTLPDGVWVEPVTGWAIAIYPDDVA